MSTPRQIWAFDPGTITGVAVWCDEEFTSHQCTITELYELVDYHCENISMAQIERFTISQRTIKASRVDDPLDVIGYLKYAAWRCNFLYDLSKPADVMATFPDPVLKRGGLFTPGKGHANDAARHLARRLVKDRLIDPKRFLA